MGKKDNFTYIGLKHPLKDTSQLYKGGPSSYYRYGFLDQFLKINTREINFRMCFLL